MLRKRILFFFLCFIFSIHASFSEHEEKKETNAFNPSELILHHIADSHEWHVATIGHTHFTIPLPVIIYSTDHGLDIFSSHCFRAEGFAHEGDHHVSRVYRGYRLDEHGKILPIDSTRTIYDFSITKNAASIMLGAFILLLVFLVVARSCRKNEGKAPKGIQSFMEPIILFVRDDIAIPNIGKEKYSKYVPYLLTVFFFVWINNLLGLIPTGANASGNIAFTAVLAIVTALITNLSGNRHYWKHIFATPGVPFWLLPIMIPVELIGILTKPFALAIRLFANITAGHIIILSLMSFIFIFKSFMVAVPAGAFMVAMTFLELFVAVLQAYIFTMLSALFIGMAVDSHHEEEHAEEHH